MTVIKWSGVYSHKFRAAAVSRRLKKSSSSGLTPKASTKKIYHRKQGRRPQHHQVHLLQRGPSENLEIVIENDPEDEVRQPKSEPQLAISIKEKLEQACKDNAEHSWEKLSIYQIPHYLKDGEDKAYVPRVVSLGPYHRGKKHLHQMDQHKWRCLHCILTRTSHHIGLYLDKVKEVEERARACYEGTISMSSDEFVEMMVLDGCFVIELFRGVQVKFETLDYPSNDPVFSMQGSMQMIQRDMLMLENQIPFFILDQLYSLQAHHPPIKEDLATMALQFFDHMRPTDGTDDRRNRLESPLQDEHKLHCLAWFRGSLLHPHLDRKGSQVMPQRRHQLIHCVTELREAGIKFSKRKTDEFWDIQFESGNLQIPQLLIHDGTRSLFLNLIAFEQCHFHHNKHITSYIIFMDNLINSPEDIKHLHDHEIIQHWLGSNAEVADLFNRLCQEVVFDINDSYLSKLSEKVNNHSSHKRYHWCFLLKHKYFGNPWLITSFIAALVLLVLTFTQTFYALYSYYKPRF